MRQTDFALYDRDRRLIALVEAKNKRGTSPEWAAQLRRNFLAHGGNLRGAEFFLLATPDHVYVWKGAGSEPRPITPTYVVDARPLFDPYFERTGLSLEEAGSQAFELAVGAWLSDLTRAAQDDAGQQAWLVDSHLLDSVRDGWLSYETAA